MSGTTKIDEQLSQLAGKPGVHQASPAQLAAYMQFRRKLDARYSLRDLQADYTFFTPGLLYMAIPFTFDLMATFYQDYGQDVPVYELEYDRELFPDLVHPDVNLNLTERRRWCRTLQALENEHWPAFRTWLLQAAFSRRRQDGSLLLYRVREQVLVITDPQAKGASDMHVTLATFVVETNQGSFYFRQAIPGFSPPLVTFDKLAVWQDTAAMARALARYETDPYQTSNEALLVAPADEGIVNKQGELHVVENPPSVAGGDGSEGHGTPT